MMGPNGYMNQGGVMMSPYPTGPIQQQPQFMQQMSMMSYPGSSFRGNPEQMYPGSFNAGQNFGMHNMSQRPSSSMAQGPSGSMFEARSGNMAI